MSYNIKLHLLSYKETSNQSHDTDPWQRFLSNASRSFLAHNEAPGIDGDALRAIVSLIYTHESVS